MNKKLLAAVMLVGSTFSVVVNAADGTINFTGSITDAACTITPSTMNQTVTLGSVATSALNGVGSTAAPSRFDIVLSSCPATATKASVKFDGPSDATNSTLLALTTSTGVATGVGIGLFEQDAATQIPVGGTSAAKNLSTTADTTFSFIAKYVATSATVVAGTADAVSDFSVTYN